MNCYLLIVIFVFELEMNEFVLLLIWKRYASRLSCNEILGLLVLGTGTNSGLYKYGIISLIWITISVVIVTIVIVSARAYWYWQLFLPLYCLEAQVHEIFRVLSQPRLSGHANGIPLEHST